MQRNAQERVCVATGFIVLDVIRHAVSMMETELRHAGGSCGNVLAILAYLGWNANAVGRIGNDYVGHELVADLANWHVNTSHLRVEADKWTPVVIQENYTDAHGRPRHRFCRVCPDCGARLPAYRPVLASEAAAIASTLPAHAVFYIDRIAPGTVELARRSRNTGALVVFEPSGVKDERLFTECLRAAHVVKYANDRIQGIHDAVARANVPIEIETLGANGLRFRMQRNGRLGSWHEVPAFPAPELRDAAGAGDWTTAGFIDTLMRQDWSVENVIHDADAVMHAIRRGQAFAALNCGFYGARGLMYEFDAKSVRDLVTSIAAGAETPRGRIRQPRTELSGRGDRARLTCTGSRALHA